MIILPVMIYTWAGNDHSYDDYKHHGPYATTYNYWKKINILVNKSVIPTCETNPIINTLVTVLQHIALFMETSQYLSIVR